MAVRVGSEIRPVEIGELADCRRDELQLVVEIDVAARPTIASSGRGPINPSELNASNVALRRFGPARRFSTYGTKHYRHPVVGELTLDCDTWSNPDGSGQRFVVLTAEPGTHSHDALRILASWTADAHPAMTPRTPDKERGHSAMGAPRAHCERPPAHC